MTIKLGRLTIELIDDTKPVYKQPRRANGQFKRDKKVIYYGDMIREINGR